MRLSHRTQSNNFSYDINNYFTFLWFKMADQRSYSFCLRLNVLRWFF